jgi:VWFA-related protein
MTMRHLILGVAAAVTVPLLAQSPQPPSPAPPAFRADTDLVEVDVIARDKSGEFVSDLALDDFELREDGKPYPVQQLYLRVAGAAGWGVRAGATSTAVPNAAAPPGGLAPRVFVVVFDDSHLTPGGFKRTQTAALNLFEKQLRAGDIGGVVSNGRVTNGRLTNDRGELIKAVKDARPSAKILSEQMDERRWPRLSGTEAIRIDVNDDQEVLDMATRRGCEEQRPICEGLGGDDPVRGPIQGKARQFSTNIRVEAKRTLSMLQQVLTGLGRLQGPKNVLLMSEGFISEDTWPEVQDAVAAAARSGTRIYTLDARGTTRGLASIDDVAPAESISRIYEQMDTAADSINSLAVDTGGFVVRNINQFDKAVAQIADDAGNYYVLGYLPPTPADGKFHKISVRVTRKDVGIRARRGYTASAKPRPEATEVPLDPDTTGADDPGRTDGLGRTDAVAVEAIGATETPRAPAAISTASIVVTAAAGGTGRMRLRPDAERHLGMLLRDPSADRAAAAGWAAYQRGDVATARASLRVAARSPTAEAWVHYALGLSEYALGSWTAAVSEWENVRANAPAFEPVYFDLVDGYLQLKEHDKAIRLLREGASNWPTDPDVFNALGVVQTARGALPDAIASFQVAIDAAPQETVSYFNLGRAYELRYFRTRRYIWQAQRWISNEKDRTAALENYERYLTFGGPYADAAREGVTRLKWASTGQ